MAVCKTTEHLGDASRLIERQAHDLPPVTVQLEESGSLLDAQTSAVSALKDGYTEQVNNILEQYTL